MRKTYRGMALPSFREVAYSLEYLCPSCNSDDVEIDASVPVPHYCDGSPCTEDTLSTWQCRACNHRGLGQEFVARHETLPTDDAASE